MGIWELWRIYASLVGKGLKVPGWIPHVVSQCRVFFFTISLGRPAFSWKGLVKKKSLSSHLLEYHTGSQTAATSTLVTSSLVIFIGIVLYHIYLQVRKTAAWEKITKRNIPQEGPRVSAAEEDSGLLSVRAPTRSYVAISDVHEYRCQQ